MSDDDIGIGNRLNGSVRQAIQTLFVQAEFAQLTHYSLDASAQIIQQGNKDEIELTYPVGYKPNREIMPGTLKYSSKEELVQRFEILAYTQLPINFIYHMTALMEAMFSDIVRMVVLEYPEKLGGNKKVPAEQILQASSIEEAHLRIADSVLHDLSYKSPGDFAVEFEKFLSVKLLECPAFHQYVEMKASRDVFVHAWGRANDIYVRKAGSRARAKSGENLPIDQIYFLECYEACLQVAEWLEQELHKKWHSTFYVERQKAVAGESTPPTEDSS